MTPFEMTNEGYQAAKKWLEQTDQLHKLEGEQSVDGFTTVALANYLLEKEMKETKKVENVSYSGQFNNPLSTVGEEGVLQREHDNIHHQE